MDEPEAVAGFGEKLAVTLDGRPEMLSVTELLAPTAVKVTVAEPLDFLVTVSLSGAEIVKSLDVELTVSDKEASRVSVPSVPLIVSV